MQEPDTHQAGNDFLSRPQRRCMLMLEKQVKPSRSSSTSTCVREDRARGPACAASYDEHAHDDGTFAPQGRAQ